VERKKRKNHRKRREKGKLLREERVDEECKERPFCAHNLTHKKGEEKGLGETPGIGERGKTSHEFAEMHRFCSRFARTSEKGRGGEGKMGL